MLIHTRYFPQPAFRRPCVDLLLTTPQKEAKTRPLRRRGRLALVDSIFWSLSDDLGPENSAPTRTPEGDHPPTAYAIRPIPTPTPSPSPSEGSTSPVEVVINAVIGCRLFQGRYPLCFP